MTNNNGNFKPKTRKHGSETMRLQAIHSLYINESGTYAEDSEDKTPQPIEEAENGKLVIRTYSDIPIEEAVAVTWLDRPYDGNAYFIEHIDGDSKNCKASNLRWTKVNPQKLTQADSVFLDDTIIRCNGEIVIGEATVDMQDSWYDDDLSLRCTYEVPHGIIFTEDMLYPEPIDVYGYLDAAGFIEVNKKDFKDPVVLHKDLDREDLGRGNLEWVSTEDQRYQEFQTKNRDYMIAKNKELNPGREQDLKLFNLI